MFIQMRRESVCMNEIKINSNKKTKIYIITFLLCILYLLPFELNMIDKNKDFFIFDHVQAEEKILPKEKLSPNKNYLKDQWNLDFMNIGEAWADGYDGKGIKIAVLDTGFYHKHPDINLAGGDSVFPEEAWSLDHSGHGTHIAGIIAAKKDAKYQGLAPGAEVYGIKIYHSNDTNEFGEVSTDIDSVIKGIQLAMKKKVDIIVISSGLNYHDDGLYKAIKEAYSKDIMIIAASGNGNLSVNYPASYKEVIAVTAIDEELNPALDIIYGEENEFSAPGVNIGGLSIPDSSYSYPYIYMSGSSQATPHVASLAAIIMQKYNIRGEEARKVMQKQAVDFGDSHLFGHGLVFYQSKEVSENKTDNEKSEKEKIIINGDKEEPKEGEENEARKPSSSRESENEEEPKNNLASYKKIKVSLLEDNKSVIEKDRFQDIKIGGRLDIFMRGAGSLSLNEEQIAEIRQKNIRLSLRQEGISWEIPPSNFVPGEAVLRFYKGEPLGTEEKSCSYSNIYTISIYQAKARRGIYPSVMTVNFDLKKQEIPIKSNLEAAYFNREEDKWLTLEKSKTENILSLETRHTGAIGIFENIEKEINKEEVAPDKIKDTEGTLSFLSIGIITSSLLFIMGILFVKNKS